MIVLYFSASGNSLSVAKEIGGNLISIPQAIKQNVYEFDDDAIGIVCPIYNLDAPKIVKRFLGKAVLKANYIFVIGTYGGKYGSFPKKIEKMFKRSGITADYINTIKMNSNAQTKVSEQLSVIKQAIAQRKRQIIPCRNRFLSAFTVVIMPLVNSMEDAQKMLRVDDAKCTKCKTCISVCPVGNIKVADKVTYGKECELCLACSNNCPQGAIHSKFSFSGTRYRNDVTLKEIIESNNQQ